VVKPVKKREIVEFMTREYALNIKQARGCVSLGRSIFTINPREKKMLN